MRKRRDPHRIPRGRLHDLDAQTMSKKKSVRKNNLASGKSGEGKKGKSINPPHYGISFLDGERSSHAKPSSLASVIPGAIYEVRHRGKLFEMICVGAAKAHGEYIFKKENSELQFTICEEDVIRRLNEHTRSVASTRPTATKKGVRHTAQQTEGRNRSGRQKR